MQKFPARPFESLTFLVILFDLLCLELSLLAGYWLWIAFPWHGHYQLFSLYSRILWVFPLLGIFVFRSIGLYKPEMGVLGVWRRELFGWSSEEQVTGTGGCVWRRDHGEARDLLCGLGTRTGERGREVGSR